MVAIQNGWVWNIPLWNRIGTGYVYSSKFVSRDDALTEFKAHSKTQHKVDVEDRDYFHIDIRHGKRLRAWLGNVVGIGLSYGFVESLESNRIINYTRKHN